MRILAIADEESAYLWDFFEKSKLEGIDLIISCGDLDPNYLSFLATFTSAPVLYVHGNHDECYQETPPSGCICIDDSIYVYKGIRILGLGGSMRYKDGPFQYTQAQMSRRAARLWPALCCRHGFDVLVTHAPAHGIGDGPSLAHTGFHAFVRLLDQYRPRIFVHGHVHLSYDASAPRIRRYRETTVINAYEKTIFSL